MSTSHSHVQHSVFYLALHYVWLPNVERSVLLVVKRRLDAVRVDVARKEYNTCTACDFSPKLQYMLPIRLIVMDS